MFALCIKLLRNEFISLPKCFHEKMKVKVNRRGKKERDIAYRREKWVAQNMYKSYMATQSFLMNATSFEYVFYPISAERKTEHNKNPIFVDRIARIFTAYLNFFQVKLRVLVKFWKKHAHSERYTDVSRNYCICIFYCRWICECECECECVRLLFCLQKIFRFY